MKTRFLELSDVDKYAEDLFICCKHNPQITDYQGYLDVNDKEATLEAIKNYIEGRDSSIEAIMDNREEYIFGFVVYDNMRLTDDGNAAECHICTARDIWGKDFLNIYEEILNHSIFNVLYCIIPSRCRGAINLCKKLGFKKTGYIPNSIPYTNVKGEVKMFDELIYSWVKVGEDRVSATLPF